MDQVNWLTYGKGIVVQIARDIGVQDEESWLEAVKGSENIKSSPRTSLTTSLILVAQFSKKGSYL